MNKRKVLSIALILALIAGSFTMAFAADDSKRLVLSDITGLPGQEEIEVCQNLGIITGNPDGTFLPSNDVNRAEFAAIITRAMGIPESALSEFRETSFLDTTGYSWAIPYLAYCNSKGIMLGDGQGNAMPGRTITSTEAMTMICRTLGYIESSSTLVGSWPANYITLAQDLRLYDKINRNFNNMTREMSAIAVYNALMVQLVTVAADGKTDPQWAVRPTGSSDGVPACLLNTGLKCTVEPDVILGVEWTPENSMINIADRIGAFGIGFVSYDKELVAFKMADGYKLVTGSVSSGSFVAEDGTKYTFSQSSQDLYWDISAVFDNTKYLSSVSGAALPGNPIGTYNNSMKLIDDIANGWTDGNVVTISGQVSGATIKSVKAIAGWHADQAVKINASQLNTIGNDDSLLGFDLPIDNYQKVSEKQIALVGIGDMSEISADDIVYVYAGGNGVVRKIAVGNEVVRGSIESLNGDYAKIGNKEYGYSSEFLISGKGVSYSDISGSAGASAVARLDAYGNAFEIDTTDGGINLSGMLLDWSGGAGLDSPIFSLFDTSGSETNYAFSGNSVKWYDMTTSNLAGVKAPVNGNFGAGSNITLRDKMAATFAGPNPAAVTPLLVGYKLDNKDKVTDFKVGLAGTLTLKSRTVATFRGSDYQIDKNVAIFFKEGGNYGTAAIANVDLSKAVNMSGQALFGMDGKTMIAMLISADAANSSSGNLYGVVNRVTHAATSGNQYSNIEGFFAGTSTTSVATTTNYGQVSFGSSGTIRNTEVGLYMFDRDMSGKVKGITRLNSGAANVGPYNRFIGEFDVEPYGVDVDNSYIKEDGTGTMLPFDEDVVVFKADTSGSTVSYTKSSIGSISSTASKPATVWLYDTKDDKYVDETATVIIWAN